MKVAPHILAATLLVAPAASAQTTDPCDLVNGTSVVGNDVTLLEDLDCTGIAVPPRPIVLSNGGVLDLNGFTLKADSAVRCDHESKPCTVTSSVPGGTLLGTLPSPPLDPAYSQGIFSDAGVRVISVTVTAFAGNGVETGLARGTKAMLESSIVTQNGGVGVLASGLLVSNSVVSDNGSGGARSAGKPTRIENSQIVGNQGFGISAAQKLKLDGAEVSGNAGHGVQLTRADFEPTLQRAVVRNSTIAANGGDGIRSTERPDARLALRLVLLSDNVASGVANVALVKGRDLTIENNGLNGIETSDAEGCRVLLSYATVRTNGFFGATLGPPEAPCAGGRFRASVSTLTGNGVDPDCFVTTACGDIASPTAPTMDGECERSYVSGSGVPGENWSRCALD